MPSEERIIRINEAILRVVNSAIIYYGNLPPTTFLTVTRVKTSSNLEWADIYVSVYPASQQPAALKFLEQHRLNFQGKMNEALHVRRTPKIRFHIDDTLAKAEGLFPAS